MTSLRLSREVQNNFNFPIWQNTYHGDNKHKGITLKQVTFSMFDFYGYNQCFYVSVSQSFTRESCKMKILIL